MNGHALPYRSTFTHFPAAPKFAVRHRVWYRTALGMVVLLGVCALLATVDNRTLQGASVWSKPIKFSMSIAFYFATMAWFAPLLADGYFSTLRGRLLTWVPVFCAIAEMLYITLQAALGQPSHFNVTTPFHATMYSLMGAGAVLMVTSTLWMGSAILWRHRLADPFVLAVALGFIATFVLGGGFGGYLGSSGGHWVGGTPSDDQGLPLLRWSTDGGDLRVAHFFGMHAMQILPLFAAFLPAALPRARGVALVLLAACGYTAFSTWTFLQALGGQPLLGH